MAGVGDYTSPWTSAVGSLDPRDSGASFDSRLLGAVTSARDEASVVKLVLVPGHARGSASVPDLSPKLAAVSVQMERSIVAASNAPGGDTNVRATCRLAKQGE